ncbi:hypothetical protein KO461_03310 [Aggregatibacter actinomycetemcomitans]|uniref:hypothetical protein n=1 Tax=Aggregatibacter actinomycetemcomitans TaxID=714 RepID=UPI00197C3248|nr:hypothetical protein [Aggregatibacter actinomycetemcomitans]MBN6062246.1 hypothetical protein [Aggregatibacter actinomycetemcomitans]UEL54041.1 hypothetical protein KO461_03310 [Aggregatibacter actinomycetemcomitans]
MDNNPVQGQLFAQPGESIASIMGILDDGTPYLTMTALSKICGLDPSTMWAFTANWNCTDDKPRTKFICDRLFAQGYDTSSLFSRINRQGQIVHAYPDYVCMAILEYYAFEAKRFDNTIARDNYRKLASYTLRRAIYESLGINSGSTPAIAKSWQVYQERILLNDQIPVTHFSIFREMADVLVRLINSQFKLDPYSVPDISVGQHWGKYWQASNLEQTFGPRIKHPHYYPDSFPQSGAGAVPAWIYPVEALGLFRKWLMTTYVNDKLEPYLNKKVQQGALPEVEKTQILHAISSNTKYLN